LARHAIAYLSAKNDEQDNRNNQPESCTTAHLTLFSFVRNPQYAIVLHLHEMNVKLVMMHCGAKRAQHRAKPLVHTSSHLYRSSDTVMMLWGELKCPPDQPDKPEPEALSWLAEIKITPQALQSRNCTSERYQTDASAEF
jgi:hypothetical protein